jgi:hypothetical protein
MTRHFRRRSACALALAAVQFALLFAAPAAACCRADETAGAAVSRVENDAECCPPGSHPPGQCPLHRRAARQSESECRIRCTAPSASGYMIGIAGMLPAPPVSRLEMRSSALETATVPVLVSQFVPPVAPPPKIL